MTLTRFPSRLVARCRAACFRSPCLTAQGGATPRTGADVLEAMRAAYAGKWYHTLTFKQKTTIRGQDGTERERDVVRDADAHGGAGTKLRIDRGDLSAGNGDDLHARLAVPRSRAASRSRRAVRATSSCRSSRACTCSPWRRR